MTFNYQATVKKHLDQNRIGCVLPNYIQRGWNRIYTLEEEQFNKQSCIIGSDTQIPNSVVRHRLGTSRIVLKTNMEVLRKAFELPDELLMNLSVEHKRLDTIDEEKLSFEWDDDDDDIMMKRKKSVVSTIITKQREKRRKHEDYKYDYDNTEPLPLDEIIEEIRTNIGKDLKNEDLKLIKELMQIISRYKQDQVMNIYGELTDVHLISKFGGVPKLVQALQEIQKAFEQVAMKTNVASIETVIDVLLEKDSTYRVAVELLSSFNENVKKSKQQQQLFEFNDKSGDIPEHDHILFNILIKDRISRLPTSDLSTLINDLTTSRNFETSKISKDHDEQVKFLSEQLNVIFTRAHFDGIKTAFDSMKSPVSSALKEFIHTVEASLKTKLTDNESIIIESYIQDCLGSLNTNELKVVYERLAQQGTLKRHRGAGELNQAITMGLMGKIKSDGLGAVIENIKDAHLDVDSINKLIEELICISNYVQTHPSVSIEQIQNQLAMAYFIETHTLSEENIQELSQAVNLYSIARIPLAEKATIEECSIFLEHLKSPFIRLCIQRVLHSIQETPIDLNKVSNQFYNQHIIDLLHELIHGSDEFNRDLLFHQVKEQLRKNKDLGEKIYRQMLKEKLMNIDVKVKMDTDKKKLSMVINEIHRMVNNKDDRIKQSKLMELFDKTDIVLPERVKHWYKTKSVVQVKQSLLAKPRNGTSDRKTNLKGQIKATEIDVKSVRLRGLPTKREITNKSINPSPKTEKNHLPTSTAAKPAKHSIERKKASLKPPPKVPQTKKGSEVHMDTSVHNEEEDKLKIKSQTTLPSMIEELQTNTLINTADQPVTSSSTTGANNTDVFNKVQVTDDFTEHNELPVTSLSNPQETIEYTDSLVSKPEKNDEVDNQQPANQQPSNTVDAGVESKKEFESLQNINLEQMTNAKFDLLQQSDEKGLDENNKVSILAGLELSQTDFQTIHLENITSGKMEENKTITFELEHDAALLWYPSPVYSDSAQEIQTILSGKIPEFLHDPQYEKTKAQRIFAKSIPSNIARQQTEGDTIGISSSSSNLIISNSETISTASDIPKLSEPPTISVDESLMPVTAPSIINIKSSAKSSRRTLNKSLKQTEDIYTTSLTNALRNLFSRSDYDSHKLRKIHEELITSGHISPLNEFYSSSNEAIRVTLDHCTTYNDLIKWTLALLQTNNKPNLIDFGHDLYSIAIDLDRSLIERIDETRYASELQDVLKHELQTITETDLREINSYLNAAQLEKIVNTSKKLNVTSKDRMLSDLYSLLLHLIQACHTFQLKYRPMQTHIREIADRFKSRAVANLAHKMDEVEKRLSKTFAITFFGASQRLIESRFLLTK